MIKIFNFKVRNYYYFNTNNNYLINKSYTNNLNNIILSSSIAKIEMCLCFGKHIHKLLSLATVI